MSQRIYLGKGFWSTVDDHNFDLASEFNWRNQDGYARAHIRGTKKDQIYLHQVIGERMGLVGHIDHEDGDGLNNLELNLREANRSQQAANSKPRVGVKGIHWRESRRQWEAHIKVNYKQIHLGYFAVMEEAIEARRAAAIRYFGCFAREL